MLVQVRRRLDAAHRLTSHMGLILREVSLLLVGAVGLYLLLALFTYHPLDPGWSYVGPSQGIHNAGGAAGAWFADVSLFLLGYLAFLVPLVVFISGWVLLTRLADVVSAGPTAVGLRLLGGVTLLLAACGLAALHIAPGNGHLPEGIGAGGALGHLVAIAALPWLGLLGATVALLALFIAGLTLSAGITWLATFETVGRWTLHGSELAVAKALDIATRVRGARAEPSSDRHQRAPIVVDSEPPSTQQPGAWLPQPTLSTAHGDAAEACADEPAEARADVDEGAGAGPVIRRYQPGSVEAPMASTPSVPSGQGPGSPAAAAAPHTSGAADNDAAIAASLAELQAGLRERHSASAAAAPDEVDELAAWLAQGRADAEGPAEADVTPPREAHASSGGRDNGPRSAEPSARPESEARAAGETGSQGTETGCGAAGAVALRTRAELDADADADADADSEADSDADGDQDDDEPLLMDDDPLDALEAGAGGSGAGARRLDPQSLRPKPATVVSPKVRVPVAKEPEGFRLPALELLDEPAVQPGGYSDETLANMSREVEAKLKDFGIKAQVVEVHPGPVITRFELQPAPGVKASRITNLSRDLARSLSVISVRVVEVIPGKSVVGLEIPNATRQTVYLSEVLKSEAYTRSRSPLTIGLGQDIAGKPAIADITKMPHLLVAGTTGSGKSVSVNAMLLSLLYKSSPADLRMILIDPKMLELSVYEGIPHLLTPVVTDMTEAANALRWAVGEMERRYRIMAALSVRNIGGYNRKVREAEAAGNPIIDPTYQPELAPDDTAPAPALEPLPYIVVVVDEFADMMMVVGKKVEELIARLAQKARAAGIHLVLATQRPSVDVITGLIKANIPARVAFQVSSRIDSRTILDQMGAESLLGYGDMLFLQPGAGIPERVHGAFVADHEVLEVAEYLKQWEPDYIEEVLTEEGAAAGTLPGEQDRSAEAADLDPLYDRAVNIVLETRKASISYVQRRLRVGYNRAARMIEDMEAAGVVGPLESNGNREVLVQAPADM